jgi:hypothetical protein
MAVLLFDRHGAAALNEAVTWLLATSTTTTDDKEEGEGEELLLVRRACAHFAALGAALGDGNGGGVDAAQVCGRGFGAAPTGGGGIG